MKKLSTLALLVALTGCGNSSVLENISGGAMGDNGNGSGDGEHEGDEEGCTGDAAAQEAAILDLSDNVCAECWPAEGTAEILFAQINPHEYTGGPLEVGLVIGNPAGLANVTTYFEINEMELAIPAAAWKLSEDGTKGRVVLLLEPNGLPAGEYHVKLAVFAAEAPAFNEEETPAETEPDDHSVDTATWNVACPDEEVPGEGEDEGEGTGEGETDAPPAE